MNSAPHVRCILVCLLAAIISGCAAPLDLAYRPEPDRKSPLSTISPLSLNIQIDDQRKQASLAVAPAYRGPPGNVIKASLDTPVVVRQAFQAEIENNGHHVRGSAADATVHVTLERYSCCDLIRLGSVATLYGTIEIFDSQGRSLGSKPLSSSFLGPANNTQTFQTMLNGVLSEFIRSFARDPVTIAALRDIELKRNKGAK